MTKAGKERNELWRITLDSYKKALDEYKSTDPSDEHYVDICNNLDDIQKKILEMAQEDKKLRWDVVKTIIGWVIGCGQLAVTFVLTLVGMDWEASNSMRSKFAPQMLQMLPKSWRKSTDN